MQDSDTYLRRLLGGALDLADEYIGAAVRVSIKTNLGPEIAVTELSLQDAGEEGGGGSSARRSRGLFDLLGIKTAVIVRAGNGSTIATYGTPPKTDPLRVAGLVLVAGFIGFLLVRGIAK